MLNRIDQAHTDAEWTLDGFEIGAVRLSSTCTCEPPFIVLRLHSSGMSSISIWLKQTPRTQSRTGSGPSNAGVGSTRIMTKTPPNGVTSSTYFFMPRIPYTSHKSRQNELVRVSGGMKAFGNKRYLNLQSVRPLKDKHEMFYHMLEVAYVKIALERGHVRTDLTSRSRCTHGIYSSAEYAQRSSQWSPGSRHRRSIGIHLTTSDFGQQWLCQQ
jgi:replication factor A2